VAAVTVLSGLTRQKAALWLCGLLIVAWTYTKVAAALWGWDTARMLFPAGDVLGLSVACFAWYMKPQQWRLGVVYAILTKLFLHVWFWRHGVATSHTRGDFYNYSLSLNILYAIEIMFVAVSGGNVIGAAIGSWVSAHWPGHRWAYAPSRRPATREKA